MPSSPAKTSAPPGFRLARTSSHVTVGKQSDNLAPSTLNSIFKQAGLKK